jgi:mannitol/fructose-specific phosphotransferase system IIA component
MDQGRHKDMVKTISNASKEHINAVQTVLTQLKEKKNMLKEIDDDDNTAEREEKHAKRNRP